MHDVAVAARLLPAERLHGVPAALPAPSVLPGQSSTFVGRERELADVVGALDRTRILTLTGAGGCGKTRLALRAAAEALARRPSVACWVELAPLTEPALAAPALASALEVRPLPGQTDLDAAVSFLAARRALVILDNCEHLLDECAAVTHALVRGCPLVTVLATSRAPLRVPGELDWRVPSLALPGEDAGAATETLAGADAVRLFVERAAEVRPRFRVNDGNAATVARICREVDGIPLAIELAAARLRVLSVEQIAAALEDRLRLLTGGVRTALPRQRTLRASVEWSHDLLPEAERVLFRRLGVFAGGFTLEGAERVGADAVIPADAVLDLVAALVEKSLVQADEHENAVRYRMLETVRQYAMERLADAGELEEICDRHRDTCLELAERLSVELLTPRQADALDRLDAEAADFEQALQRAASSDPQKALRLCVALTLWWRLRGRFTVADAAFRRALGATNAGPSALHAQTLWGRAYLLAFSGRFDAALDVAERALDEAEQCGDARTVARASMVLGKCRLMHDPPAAARPRLARARELALANGDDLCLMHVTQALAFSHMFQEDYETARRLFDAVLDVVKRTDHQEFLANHWIAAGWMRLTAGDLAGALSAVERAAVAARRIGDSVTEAGATAYEGCAHIAAGRPERALERLVPVHGRALARGAGFLLPWAEVAIAHAHAADGRLEEAQAAFEDLLRGPAGSVLYTAAWAHAGQAETLRLLGDEESAEAAAGRALELAAGRLENPWLAARARLVLGRLAAGARRWTRAEQLLHEALAALVEGGHRLAVPEALEALAEVAAGLGSHVEAARVLGAVRRARDELGIYAWRDARAEVETLHGRLVEALGDEALQRALAEGGAMAEREAVAWLRRARGRRKRPPGGWESLTPTELEVVRHAVAGLTNPQIGERLFISRSTVKVHLAHVYAKLNLRHRGDLIREASRAPEVLAISHDPSA